MKFKKRYAALLICLVIFFVTPLYAKSPVWRISKGDRHLYIGGTFHLLSESDYPLPRAFDTAYGDSTILVLEADAQKLNTPEYQTLIARGALYENDRTIADFLKPETLNALITHMENRGISFEQMARFKPGILSLTLTLIELQMLGHTGTGVDEFYHLKARNDSKGILFLETVEEQINFILDLGVGNENAFIAYTLEDISKIEEQMTTLKAAWESGDNNQLEADGLTPWKNLFPNIYRTMLANRNARWIPQIEKLMATGPVELVLFGALHLVGEDGMLQQLRNRGFKVENM